MSRGEYSRMKVVPGRHHCLFGARYSGQRRRYLANDQSPFQMGAESSPTTAPIHVSGHGYEDEIRLMYHDQAVLCGSGSWRTAENPLLAITR
ncbi:MAG: hypothetical protein R2688_04200 [Fimbriimonadaceae bacterium]